MLEGLVTWIIDGINGGVGLGTGIFDGKEENMFFGITWYNVQLIINCSRILDSVNLSDPNKKFLLP